ncbi:MAG: clostripain-related cysteine peptidase [bacterium]
MLKKLLGCLGVSVLLSSMAFSGELKVNFDQMDVSAKDFVRAEIADIIPAPEPEQTVKDWTIMVYVNAKNNLERFGLIDLNEMEMVGSTDRVNVVAELGRKAGYDSSDGDWMGSRRYLVKKDDNFSAITSPVVQEIAKTDMGDYMHLAEFGKWAKENYPAKHYMLVVWNHGSGWNKKRFDFSPTGISYDDETGNHITTPQLGMALKEIGGVDVYGSDACLMQMPEVDYEIMPYADYIVGSEETEPGDGYTYNTFLGPIAENPGMTPEEVGRVAVNAYADHYQQQNEGTTQSLIRSAELIRFIPLLNDWTSAVMKANDTTLVKSAKNSAQDYAVYDNKDLYHFVQLINAGTLDAAVAEKGKALMSFIENDLVSLNRTVTSQYDNSHGIAIYLPGWSFNSSYDQLAWAKDTQWDEFAKWVISIRE